MWETCRSDHALGSCEGRGPRQPGRRRSSPEGPHRRQAPGSYLASEAGQCSSSRQTVRPVHEVLSLSCRHSVGKPQAGPLRTQIRENSPPLLGTLAYKGCLPRPSQLGAWRRVLPPQSRGPGGFPPKLRQNPARATTTFPPLVCPAFQLNPNYKWV